MQECREHYGREVNISQSGITPETVDFRVGNFFVGVSFLNERVAHIYYFKQGAAWGKKFSDEEVNALLEKNSNGCEWKPESNIGHGHVWYNEYSKERRIMWTAYQGDRALMTADYVDDSLSQKPRPTVTIETVEYARVVEQALRDYGEQHRQQIEQDVQQMLKTQKERNARAKTKEKRDAEKNTNGL